jgi:hypothetical protein
MLHLLAAMLLAPGAMSHPEINVNIREQRVTGPVTDKDIRPVRPPECRTEAEVQLAVQQVRNGEGGDCWVRDASAFSRYR